MRSIRILLVDERELVREGLRHILEAEEDMQVVGSYASAEEALVEMARLYQDIILIGTQMAGMNWIEATRSLRRNRPDSGSAVIILADSVDYRAEAIEAGAADYLLRNITHVELVQTIRQVYRNWHSAKESRNLVEEVIELVVPPPANAAQLLRFMCQLAEKLHDDFASIICAVGSWDRGTTVTIRPHSTTPSGLAAALANMTEVEKVEEEPVGRSTFSIFTKKFGLLPRSNISPSARIHVKLKETSTAEQPELTIHSVDQSKGTGF